MDDVHYERVVLNTPNPFVLTDHKGFDPSRTVELKAELYTPATLKGPHPAVVVSEGLGGVKTARERRYGRFLAQNGFVALVIDSFAARGHDTSPDPIRALRVTETMMVADAFTSLVWLAERDDVDPCRIYNIGFSYGGMICILTSYEQIRRHFVDSELKFAAHVSYYGPTIPRLEDYVTTGAPVAIFNGELDANVNFERLELIAQDLRNGGSPVENYMFENTYHQWDSNDHVPRFDRFNIHDGAVRITPEYEIWNEKGNFRVNNFSTRLMMLARSVSLKGFYLLRDPDIMRQTDEILLRYLAMRADRPGPVPEAAETEALRKATESPPAPDRSHVTAQTG